MHGSADPIVPYDGGAVATFGGRGQGGNVLSVGAAAEFWARRNSCASKPQVADLPDSDKQDGTTVSREEFVGCQKNATVVVYTINGGGHTWPGGLQYLPPAIIRKTTREINSSEVNWEFLSTNTLPY